MYVVSVCVLVCVYVSVCVCKMCVCVHIHVCVSVTVCVCMCVCMCVCVWVGSQSEQRAYINPEMWSLMSMINLRTKKTTELIRLKSPHSLTRLEAWTTRMTQHTANEVEVKFNMW